MSRDVEGMLESCEQLGRGLKSLLDDLAGAEADAAPHENEVVPINELTPRALRERVLSDLSAGGVRMKKISGVIYQSPPGVRVAMPFSHHLGGGRWFLDTPHERNFDEVLLLCAADDGVRHFHLTRRFLRDNVKELGRGDT
jgi:hypothetical protein